MTYNTRILKKEVERAKKFTKNEKAVGSHEVHVETLKLLSPKDLNFLTKLFNKCIVSLAKYHQTD